MKRSLFILFLFLTICVFPFCVFAEEIPFSAEATLENRLSMIRQGSYEVKGIITLSKPADKIICSITDERRASEVYSYTYYPDKKALSVPLSAVIRSSAFSKLAAGEKTLRVFCETDSQRITALEVRFTVLGKVGAYSEVTKKCTFDTHQSASYFTNGSYYKKYSWTPSERENALTVHFPSNTNVSCVQIEWLTPPKAFSFEWLSSDGTILSKESHEEDYALYSDAFTVDKHTRSVRITVDDFSTAICALHVFDENGPDVDIQSWSSMPEKLDILHVSTHQDDELLFFGGSIPYHSASGLETGVLYMVDCGRDRYAEALSGLWIAGLKYHPAFLGLMDSVPENYDIALRQWNGMDYVTELLVEQIRKYKPEVIVTHGEDGEYRHYHHIVTTDTVYKAVECAADSSYHPESIEKYGAWQVKKLYRHQTFGENVITMDWNTPMDEYDGRTPLEMAEIAYNRHVSQISYLPFSFGLKYAPDTFALVYSTVGNDIIGGDFFENIHH